MRRALWRAQRLATMLSHGRHLMYPYVAASCPVRIGHDRRVSAALRIARLQDLPQCSLDGRRTALLGSWPTPDVMLNNKPCRHGSLLSPSDGRGVEKGYAEV